MAWSDRPTYPKDMQSDPADLAAIMQPNAIWTSVAGVLYEGIKHPNLLTREDQVLQYAIPLPQLANVAGQMLPGPNTASKSPGGVRMSVILRQFEQALVPIQNFILGAP